MSEIQYIEQARKGLTVTYGNACYRIQDDGKGWLHIVVKRKKIDLKKVLLFDYGGFQDWVFNQWHNQFPVYEDFKLFAEHEKLCL